MSEHTMQDSIEGKICSYCEQWVPLVAFHRHKIAPDGLQYRCKKCSSIIHRAYRATEQGLAVCRAADKRHKMSERCKATRKRYIERGKYAVIKRRYHLSEKGKQQRRASTKRARERYPAKKRAIEAVQQAVSKGTLPNVASCACSDCSTQAEEYHHDSYEKEHWLNVTSLCRRCHRTRHSKILG